MKLKLDKTASRVMANYGDLESAEFFDDPEEVAPEERELWHAAQGVDGDEPCEVELSPDAATQLWAEVENELRATPWCETKEAERSFAAYRRDLTASLKRLEAQGVKRFVHVCDA